MPSYQESGYHLPQVHDQRQMIQRVGTVKGTFARCFDTFILGGIPTSFHLLVVIVISRLSFVDIFWCYTGAYPFVIKVNISVVASRVSPFCSEFCFKASPSV
ncbi:hypothetical protein CK203_112908 [Vitis vinifera]|uniref:Uncharacterized protein n=1 Tax=Vitis vinifera TaxID=29760 RepID=A0A438CBA3_VITVI|nr:hypothetical protein CK203_112908 [Vitis vinifera]